MSPATWPRPDPLHGRLLTLDPGTGALADREVGDLVEILRPGDVLVVNDAATLPASYRVGSIEIRLAGRKADGRFRAVLFGDGDWHQATTERPAPVVPDVGDVLRFSAALSATVVAVSPLSPRLVELEFSLPDDELHAELFRIGRPVQYWYLDDALDEWHVQTPFAGRPWAVEMPSAGRPLTVPLLAALRRRGVTLAAVTHAAGLSATGDEALDRALPLPELSEVPESTVAAIARARRCGGRVIAVGTSVVRALEGSAVAHGGVLTAWRGETALRIGPGFLPRVVDGILSGMHESGESHFDLLGTFASPGLLERATAHAGERGYLCHEFGDSTLILMNQSP